MPFLLPLISGISGVDRLSLSLRPSVFVVV